MDMDYFLNGTLDNYIDRLCAAMEYVDKEWAGKVVPAAAEQIKRLCSLAGISGKPLKLPEAYMAYLKRMGQNDGGLLEWEWGHCTGSMLFLDITGGDNPPVYLFGL